MDIVTNESKMDSATNESKNNEEVIVTMEPSSGSDTIQLVNSQSLNDAPYAQHTLREDTLFGNTILVTSGGRSNPGRYTVVSLSLGIIGISICAGLVRYKLNNLSDSTTAKIDMMREYCYSVQSAAVDATMAQYEKITNATDYMVLQMGTCYTAAESAVESAVETATGTATESVVDTVVDTAV